MEIIDKKLKEIRCCLAGNPNVGKSVIFNKLTGLSQIIGNWPGKTIKKAEGYTIFNDYKFYIIDLPGIYSLSTYSIEEIVSREYILDENPDYIINVIDSNHLERNLFLTFQLLLLKKPVILVLNQYDILQKREYEIDIQMLEELLGIPVVITVAVHNRGVHEILEKIIDIETGRYTRKIKEIKFGKEVEQKINEIEQMIINKNLNCFCTPKFAAIKLIEKDEHIIERLNKYTEPNKKEELKNVLKESYNLCEHLEKQHGENISLIINAEFYNLVSKIAYKVIKIKQFSRKMKWHDKFDHLTLHSIFGYIFLILIIFGSYAFTFKIGDLISDSVERIYEIATYNAKNIIDPNSLQYKIIWNGIVGSFFAAIGGVLPYVIPFYFILEILQDTGYLPRVAYLMDKFMHLIGVHGKSIIPVLLGFGCNVPAVMAARIMETEKERRRTIFLVTLIPCSATSTIVLGLVGYYLGLRYAFILYLINFSILIVLGRIWKKFDKEKESELIIELHEFRKPNFNVIFKQTWHSSKEFIYRALPLIIILGTIIQIVMEFNIMDFVNVLLSPITVYILGLPISVGIFLLYGILRKELNLVLLQIYVVSLGLEMSQFMSPIQMFVFTIVTMLYIPCLATMITIGKDVGWRFSLKISILEIIIAIIIGGILNWGFKILSFIF